MTQSSRPQADNINTSPLYIDSGPYSRDQWSERVYVAHTGDENTAGQRTRLRGVVPTFDNMLVVTEPVAGTIRVGTGAGIVYGSYLFNSAAVDFNALGAAPAANPRIDLVCLVENNTNAPVTDGTAANGWIFPTALADYNGLASIPAYTARLVIVKGAEAGAPVEPALDVSNTLFMVAIAKYQIAVGGVISAFVDRREFADIERVVSVNAADNDTIADALILGVEVNDGAGAADLGVAIKFRLENSAGAAEDAGQLAVRYTDPAAGDETRLEMRLKANGSDNLAMVIESPTSVSVDGNARGAGSVDFQQSRNAATEVPSGAFANVSGGRYNTASGDYAGVLSGYTGIASGDYANVSGGSTNTASGNYSDVSGGINNVASGESAHAEGYFSTAGGAAAHTEGSGGSAAGVAAHAEGGTSTASGDYSHAEGRDGTASANYSHAGGYYATAAHYGQMTRAAGRFSANGDAQGTPIVLARRAIASHTDTTWYDLYLDGATPSLLTIPADTMWTFDVLVVGLSSGATSYFSYYILGSIINDGGTTTTLGPTTTTIAESDANYDARASFDDATDTLVIQVRRNGGADHDVRWVASIRMVEVSFP